MMKAVSRTGSKMLGRKQSQQGSTGSASSISATDASGLTDAQRECVNKMKEANPSVDAATVERFAKARDYKFDTCNKLLQEDIKWREKVKPAEIKQSDCPKALPYGAWRSLGVSTGPRELCKHSKVATIWIQVTLWFPSMYDTEEYIRLAVYFCDRVLTKQAEKVIIIFDMSGWSMGLAFHLPKVLALLSVLQDHYVERLEAALLLRTPAIFSASWNVIKGLMNRATAAAVAFLPTNKAKEAEALAKYVNPAVLPAIYGGSVDGASVPCPNIEGEENFTILTKKGW